jgi:hypothetical protein
MIPTPSGLWYNQIMFRISCLVLLLGIFRRVLCPSGVTIVPFYLSEGALPFKKKKYLKKIFMIPAYEVS